MQLYYKSILFVFFLLTGTIGRAQDDSTNVTGPALDTVSSLRRLEDRPFRHSLVPFSLVGYGLLAQAVNPLDELDRSLQGAFSRSSRQTRVDDYLQYAPVAAFYGMKAAGLPSRHNLVGGTLIYLLSAVVVTVTTQGGKRIFGRTRPDGSSDNSFPSGHTATAFAGAEFFNREYGGLSPWYGVAAYTTAATTGYLRIYNNKHWFSDVLAGAGIGILSARFSGWLAPRLFRRVFRRGPRS